MKKGIKILFFFIFINKSLMATDIIFSLSGENSNFERAQDKVYFVPSIGYSIRLFNSFKVGFGVEYKQVDFGSINNLIEDFNNFTNNIEDKNIDMKYFLSYASVIYDFRVSTYSKIFIATKLGFLMDSPKIYYDNKVPMVDSAGNNITIVDSFTGEDIIVYQTESYTSINPYYNIGIEIGISYKNYAIAYYYDNSMILNKYWHKDLEEQEIKYNLGMQGIRLSYIWSF